MICASEFGTTPPCRNSWAAMAMSSGMLVVALSVLGSDHTWKWPCRVETDLIGSGKKQKSFATVHPDTAARYSAEDADYTFRLRGILAPKIEEMKLAPLYYDMELPLIPVLARLEKTGVRIDTVFLKKLSVQMEEETEAIVGGIYALAGQEWPNTLFL